ncbi:S-layer domain protein [Thermanaerovibrio acidaminovorans DSM 6589]|uniref:S-layer domain protein n=1 Tax=Thermanaerovibrio acidaminovorans (strain ATCC 49978 / DSM 6589 / Su883) TaxID=525903 RepID=D1B664_THEAS|nr:S-layer homology domain-containing protein [Thermanaerovibrio acidaminovorans]ACZ19505.1 S-layer domain protein [Thermanaerovibrio acidaminovorans DSM 6589]
MKKSFVLFAAALLVAFAAPAFAANPFMDVPMNHWAYDAVSQLASKGVISGYPDGSYKGGQPATRYEMASIVARALAKVDLDKASKQDVEMLKKLVVEFKDELDALGVKVDKLDSRVAVLEKDLGGWSLAGEFRFDAKFANEDNTKYDFDGKNEFSLNRYRIWIKKRINETTTFTSRLGYKHDSQGYDSAKWDYYYVTTKLPYDITMTAGLQNIDWEDERGLYVDNEAFVGDWTLKGFRFQKSFGMVDFDAFVSHWDDGIDSVDEYFMYGARMDFNFNEQFRLGVMGVWRSYDYAEGSRTASPDVDNTYGADMEFKFNPSVSLKGAYYKQNLWGTVSNDSPVAYKVILDVKQDLLKFTSLWLEYAKIDDSFVMTGDRDSSAYSNYGAEVLANRGAAASSNDDTTVFFARAEQKWNDKWSTFQRYLTADVSGAGVDDTKNYTFGVAYQYNPAVKFELVYDKIDYGTDNPSGFSGDDNLVRFRTHVVF